VAIITGPARPTNGRRAGVGLRYHVDRPTRDLRSGARRGRETGADRRLLWPVTACCGRSPDRATRRRPQVSSIQNRLSFHRSTAAIAWKLRDSDILAIASRTANGRPAVSHAVGSGDPRRTAPVVAGLPTEPHTGDRRSPFRGSDIAIRNIPAMPIDGSRCGASSRDHVDCPTGDLRSATRRGQETRAELRLLWPVSRPSHTPSTAGLLDPEPAFLPLVDRSNRLEVARFGHPCDREPHSERETCGQPRGGDRRPAPNCGAPCRTAASCYHASRVSGTSQAIFPSVSRYPAEEKRQYSARATSPFRHGFSCK